MRPAGVNLAHFNGSYALSHGRPGVEEERASEMSHDSTFELLDRQRVLKKHLAAIASYLESCTIGDNTIAALDVLQAMKDAQSHSAHIGRFLHQMASPIPSHEQIRTSKSTAKTIQVLSIPELLEKILGFLTTPEKLKAMRVQRTWFNTICGSIHLMRSLGLAHSLDGFYYSVFSKQFVVHDGRPGATNRTCPWVESYMQPLKTYRERPVWSSGASLQRRGTADTPPVVDIYRRLGLFIEARDSPGLANQLGSRVRAMAICTPPIYSLLVRHFCAGYHMHKDKEGKCGTLNETSHVRSESAFGFTVGEVVDLSKKLLADHRLCRNGFLTFYGTISLMDDDPLVKEQLRRAEREKQEWIRNMAEQAKQNKAEVQAAYKMGES